MAGSAERLEVFKRVVPLVKRGGSAKPVNVVNVQIIICSASLAGVVVAFQRFDAVATEDVVVFCSLAILLNLVGIFIRPCSNPCNVNIITAWLTPALWSSRIFKVRPAIFTRNHLAPHRCAPSITLRPTLFGAFATMVFIATHVARFLGTASGPIFLATNRALAICKAPFCFAVGSKRTWFAPLCVWGRSCYCGAAIGAVNLAIGLHMRYSKLNLNIYSGSAS